MTQKKNFAESRLASGITSAATTLNLFTNDGQWFPASDFHIGVYPSRYRTPTLASRAGKFEWIYVGTRTTDACAGLLRGQRGTVALDHNVSGETYTVIHSLAVEDLQEVSAAALIPNVIYVRKTMNTDVTLRSYETEQAALDAIPTAGASKPTASNRYVILGDALSDFSGLSWTAHIVAGTAPYIRVVDINSITQTSSGTSLPSFNSILHPKGTIFLVTANGEKTRIHQSDGTGWNAVNSRRTVVQVTVPQFFDGTFNSLQITYPKNDLGLTLINWTFSDGDPANVFSFSGIGTKDVFISSPSVDPFGDYGSMYLVFPISFLPNGSAVSIVAGIFGGNSGSNIWNQMLDLLNNSTPIPDAFYFLIQVDEL